VQRLAGIEVRAGDDPDGFALADDAGELTWAQVAREVEAAGGEMLAVATGPDDRVAVVGENLAPTLLAHAAGILAGVGTVAVSRQLTADEMADQFRDAGVVAVVTGPAGLAAAAAAARETAAVVVVHSTDELPEGTTSWAAWTAAGRTLPESTDRTARPPLVYTSGTTG
jgi:acyl-CoA synthetase (AMP-forming)/AMP-acid ligase II